MEKHHFSIKNIDDLLCVEFPAIVKSPEKAIQMLGGTDTLSRALKNTETHPTLNFHPQDIYSKPIIGTKKERHILVFRATSSGDSISVEFMGKSRQTFSFEGLADFSYLPVDRKPSGDYVSLKNVLKLDNVDLGTMLERPQPLFMQPLTFFRLDKSLDFAYRYKNKQRKSVVSAKYIFQFGEKIPKVAPKEQIFDNFRNKLPQYYREFERCFKEKVIWSSPEILARGIIKHHILKKYVAGFAYTYRNGPWRNLWVAIGFDPTINPVAKSYQLVEVRFSKLDCQDIPPRGSQGNFSLSRDSLRPISLRSFRDSLNSVTLDIEQNEPKSKPIRIANNYTPGVLPTSYNSLFYVHSIGIDEVKTILHQNDGQERECTFQDGWLTAGAVLRIREIVLDDIKNTLADNGVDRSLSNVLEDSIED